MWKKKQARVTEKTRRRKGHVWWRRQAPADRTARLGPLRERGPPRLTKGSRSGRERAWGRPWAQVDGGRECAWGEAVGAGGLVALGSGGATCECAGRGGCPTAWSPAPSGGPLPPAPCNTHDRPRKTVLGQAHALVEKDNIRSVPHTAVRINSQNQRAGVQSPHIQIREDPSTIYHEGKSFLDVKEKPRRNKREYQQIRLQKNTKFCRNRRNTKPGEKSLELPPSAKG